MAAKKTFVFPIKKNVQYVMELAELLVLHVKHVHRAAVRDWCGAGHLAVFTTQVPHEGSDLAVSLDDVRGKNK